MKIAIGNDHAGTEYKKLIIKFLKEKSIEVINYGTDESESVDYPDFAHPVAKAVDEGKVDYGIVICGSGNGVAMTINKYKNVRGALCWNAEITILARTHNNANILSLPARYISEQEAIAMVKVFISTEFEGGRHERRINKIPCV